MESAYVLLVSILPSYRLHSNPFLQPFFAIESSKAALLRTALDKDCQ